MKVKKKDALNNTNDYEKLYTTLKTKERNRVITKISTGENWLIELKRALNSEYNNNLVLEAKGKIEVLGACPLLKLNSKGEVVKAVQKRLIEIGYFCGSYGADGFLGNGTRNAIVEFQKDNRILIDGIIGKKTWLKLLEISFDKAKWLELLKEELKEEFNLKEPINLEDFSLLPIFKEKSYGILVKLIQAILLQENYYTSSIKVNGLFDWKTKEAIMKFQKQKGLSQDGIVGKDTWEQLLKL